MEKLYDKLIRIRRHIHMHPELGNNEFATAKFIEKELRMLSIQTIRAGKTGVVGLLKSNVSHGRTCIALRADMDALPLQTQLRKSYASKVKGCMHACGHDGNMAVVLGAADILSKRRNEFNGAVKLVFQPNEESGGGAVELIKHGVLKNPDVHAIVGIHVNSWLKTGTIGLRRGRMMAAVDRFVLEIYGEGGHGAYPHEGKDAVAIASQIIQAFHTFTSRCIDATEPVVISIGKINGGERFNILAGKVTLEGTVRSLSKKLHQELPRKLENIVKACVRLWDADYRWTYEVLGDTLINNDVIMDFAHTVAARRMGRSRVHYIEKPSMGGEDFAEYLKYIPGCFIYLGIRKNKTTSYVWHHPKFDLDEKSLPVGSEFLAGMALEYLKST